MDFEQIVKQIEWLDEEHRKDKQIIAQLSDQIKNFDSINNVLSNQIKGLSKEISRLSSSSTRIDQYDGIIKSLRDDLVKSIKTVENNSIETQKESEKKINLEISGITKAFSEFQKTINIKEIRQQIDTRIREEEKTNKILTSIEGKISSTNNKQNEILNTQMRMEEEINRGKKLSDEILVEQNSQKKKFFDLRNQVDLIPESIRRIETRINDINSNEAERKHSQKDFLEQQALLQVDRDQMQKALKEKIEKLGNQSQLYESHLQKWDSTQREVQQAQKVYEDLSQKLERRINEITEMQRLSEDRFRQEWTTFRADYQKRWTSYSLSQDELFKEMKSEIHSIQDQLGQIDDLTQTQQDIIQQTRSAQEEYYQGILSHVNQLLSTYERIIGSTTKK